jgi:hypothetical protein
MSTSIVIEGTLTKVAWGNPHTYLVVETVDASGRPVVQNVEAGPTAVLGTGGVTTSSLRAGGHVTLRTEKSSGMACDPAVAAQFTRDE